MVCQYYLNKTVLNKKNTQIKDYDALGLLAGLGERALSTPDFGEVLICSPLEEFIQLTRP